MQKLPPSNICVLGPRQSGKTSFISYNVAGYFKDTYFPTQEINTYMLKLMTNYGTIKFHVLDVPDLSYLNCRIDGAIIMNDICSGNFLNEVKLFVHEYTKKYPGTPIVVVGTKYDIRKSRYPTDLISKWITCNRCNIKFYLISCKSSYNLRRPFIDLARRIYANYDLTFIN